MGEFIYGMTYTGSRLTSVGLAQARPNYTRYILYVKEAAKEMLPEGKHITFLQVSIPLNARLAGS